MKHKYVGVQSAVLPLPHNENIPVPTYPSPDVRSTLAPTTEYDYNDLSENYSLFKPGPSVLCQPILITQNEWPRIIQ